MSNDRRLNGMSKVLITLITMAVVAAVVLITVNIKSKLYTICIHTYSKNPDIGLEEI